VHRPPARRPRLVAGALIVGALAGCRDDGPHDTTPHVVAVAAQPCRRPTRDLGVGVVIGDDTVLTAAHIVDGPRRSITVDDRAATVVALDARTDLALLTVDIPGPSAALQPLSSEAARVATTSGSTGVRVLRTGPLIVRDATTGGRNERVVHTFVPSVPEGTSGAPLLDGRDHVVGLVVLDNRTDDTAYAVTSDEIDRFLAQPRIADARSDCLD
jgi:S1-C subfamily serine protease